MKRKMLFINNKNQKIYYKNTKSVEEIYKLYTKFKNNNKRYGNYFII